MVKAKKHLGQHFLNDPNIASKIAHALTWSGKVLEIGPGTGALTQHLLKKEKQDVFVIEIDNESVAYLNKNFETLHGKIIEESFLSFNSANHFDSRFAIVGNFPYNISSQILFKVLELKNQVPEVVGMFQKEVAERVCAKPNSKIYGIISVLIQAFYETEYLFTVNENVFIPPPKVKSGVLRLTRKTEQIECDEIQLKKVVKMAFNQRRKTLRNSLKQLIREKIKSKEIFNNRPEQLSVNEFINLTNLIHAN